MVLDKGFFLQDTEKVARELLGKVIVRKYDNKILRARIVETEAYLGIKDKAAHTYGGRRTDRTETMFKEGGICYVYFTYGMYNLLNIVTERENTPTAVLIRGIEPISDINEFSLNRYNDLYNNLSSYKKKNITNGPGKLTIALNIDRSFDGKDLFGDEIYIEDDGFRDYNIVSAKRVGIDYAEEWKDCLLRYYIKGNKYVSVL